MTLPVVTRPAAAAEIEAAYQWYEKERRDLGSEFLEAVDKMIKVIDENPERFRCFERMFAALFSNVFHTAFSTASFPAIS